MRHASLMFTMRAQCIMGGDIEHWVQKLPLSKCLDKKLDGRGPKGLRDAITRAEQKNQLDRAGRLRNYQKKVESAQTLCTSSLKLLSDSELYGLIEPLEDVRDAVVLPTKIKTKILERKCQQLLNSRSFAELFKLMMPLQSGKWDARNPCVAALQEDEEQTLASFERIYSDNILKELIAGGEEKASQVVDFCKLVVQKLNEVDTLELSKLTTTTLGNCNTICTALLAIQQEDLLTVHEAWPSKEILHQCQDLSYRT
eukprot:5590627-Amphidinium_carterae.1